VGPPLFPSFLPYDVLPSFSFFSRAQGTRGKENPFQRIAPGDPLLFLGSPLFLFLLHLSGSSSSSRHRWPATTRSFLFLFSWRSFFSRPPSTPATEIEEGEGYRGGRCPLSPLLFFFWFLCLDLFLSPLIRRGQRVFSFPLPSPVR